jgi:hypothetical protein
LCVDPGAKHSSAKILDFELWKTKIISGEFQQSIKPKQRGSLTRISVKLMDAPRIASNE